MHIPTDRTAYDVPVYRALIVLGTIGGGGGEQRWFDPVM